MSDINNIFKLLDEWSVLPNYQLERRADIYFAYYMPTIFAKYLEEEITSDNIIPEFPLKQNENSNKSDKVDYAIICEEKVYLVELKTSMSSLINKKQEEYLNRAKGKEFPTLIKEIYDIRYARYSHAKYSNLIGRLQKVPKIGTIPIPENDKKWLIDAERDKIKSEIEVKPRKIEVVFIQPNKKTISKAANKVISFDEVAKAIEKSIEESGKKDNALAKRFIESLSVW